ncbi:hypothetical protein [Actinokineospora inagensis]|uniref:hypothetical protein n=1 Tax=Actinokineospora inagensis TaxID=103730 RepID=UPI00041D69BA|nr:hypothetical protein [Actinokineospora inagensis]
MGYLGKTALLAATAAAALTLTACNDSAAPGAPANGGTGATGTTADSSAGGQAFSSLSGLSDAVQHTTGSAKTVHVKMTGGIAGQAVNGEGDYQFGDPTAMQFEMKTSAGEMSMRLVGNVMYMKSPQSIVPGKPWMKFDLGANNALAKSMDSVKQTDPSKIIAQIVEAGDLTGVKSEPVDGQDTVHYTVTIDITKLKADNALGMDADAIAAAGKAGMKTFTIDMWINHDNLPVRMVNEIPMQGKTVKTQSDYSDWGKPVTITAPPASEVATLPGS